MARRIAIIGTGIGGLATANLLARAGFRVVVYEKHATAGGRAGLLQQDGFRFDTGPSWYLMPDVFNHYYELLGYSADKELSPQRLAPAYKVFFENNTPMTIKGDIDTDAVTFESIEAGSGKRLKEYVQRSDEIYQMSIRHFLYSNFTDKRDLLHRDIVKKAVPLVRLSLQSVDRYVSRIFRDKRLRQILEYPAVFLGTSPFEAPALYSMMSVLDFKDGVYYPKNGMYSIVASLEKIGRSLGVEYRYGSEVAQIASEAGRAVGVKLADGTFDGADIVVSNADLQFTESQLLAPQDQTHTEQYWRKKQPSPSALLLYLGIKGKIPEFEHHNLLFVDGWRENFAAMKPGAEPPQKASLYISKTSQTEKDVAPKGCEAVFVLVPLPPGVEYGSELTERLVDRYLQQITDMTGVDLMSRIVTKKVFGPDDFRTKLYSWQSSMLGQSHILGQSAFFRAPNKSKKLDNMYYVGGNTQPGVGVPMCLISAELVYKRIAGERRGGRVTAINQTLGDEG